MRTWQSIRQQGRQAQGARGCERTQLLRPVAQRANEEKRKGLCFGLGTSRFGDVLDFVRIRRDHARGGCFKWLLPL